ncbi:hypothetical protein GCM10027596_35870 [Nocardioides korecus]
MGLSVLTLMSRLGKIGLDESQAAAALCLLDPFPRHTALTAFEAEDEVRMGPFPDLGSSDDDDRDALDGVSELVHRQ